MSDEQLKNEPAGKGSSSTSPKAQPEVGPEVNSKTPDIAPDAAFRASEEFNDPLSDKATHTLPEVTASTQEVWGDSSFDPNERIEGLDSFGDLVLSGSDESPISPALKDLVASSSVATLEQDNVQFHIEAEPRTSFSFVIDEGQLRTALQAMEAIARDEKDAYVRIVVYGTSKLRFQTFTATAFAIDVCPAISVQGLPSEQIATLTVPFAHLQKASRATSGEATISYDSSTESVAFASKNFYRPIVLSQSRYPEIFEKRMPPIEPETRCEIAGQNLRAALEYVRPLLSTIASDGAMNVFTVEDGSIRGGTGTAAAFLKIQGIAGLRCSFRAQFAKMLSHALLRLGTLTSSLQAGRFFIFRDDRAMFGFEHSNHRFPASPDLSEKPGVRLMIDRTSFARDLPLVNLDHDPTVEIRAKGVGKVDYLTSVDIGPRRTARMKGQGAFKEADDDFELRVPFSRLDIGVKQADSMHLSIESFEKCARIEIGRDEVEGHLLIATVPKKTAGKEGKP